MTPERWEKIDRLFKSAIEQSPNDRAAFLKQACSGEDSLAREVELLIAAHERSGEFLDRPTLGAISEKAASKLTAGQRVNHYEILDTLGVGGMGEVYLAYDTRLARKVAIKLLPADFGRDEQLVRRFEQEARAASALSHPNVCVVHEIARDDNGRIFIAMEYVEGITLRDRLTRDRVPLSEAIDLTTQIAAALAAAHAAGIVHRDIKPENLVIRNDGLVKVLDFGLAKRTAPATLEGSNSLVNTNPGAIMGTVNYMSPEQVRGHVVDERTDIWSLGVVLYEMLTGRAPFQGQSASEVMVSILEREPLSLLTQVPDLPLELHRIVNKTLRKDREERYQGVKDLLVDVKSLRQAEGVTHSGAKLDQGLLGMRFIVVAGLLASALLPAAVLFLTRGTEPPQPPLTAIPLTSYPGYEGMPSISPDGNQVAFGSFGERQANLDIYIKLIGGGPPLRLTSDPAPDLFPAWSPDGRSIAFLRDQGDKLDVLVVPALGGPERKLAQTDPELPSELALRSPYLSWFPDSKYLVTIDRLSPGEPPSLFLLSLATGEKQRLTSPPATVLCDASPAVSPDGRMLAFVRLISSGIPQLHLLPLANDYAPAGEAKRLNVPQPWVVNPAWTQNGQELICSAGQPYFQDGRLWRVPLADAEKPQPLFSVGEKGYQASIARHGNLLVYSVWMWDADIWRIDLSGDRSTTQAEKLIASTRGDFNPQYSPDGSRIALESDRSGNEEIWLFDSNGSKPVQLTSMGASTGTARWFPDGRRIVFDSQKEGQREIYLIDINTRVPQRLTNDPRDDITPSVSHDGQWIYFASNRSGQWEIWRMPAGGGQAQQITRNGGVIPFESPDGKVIYYQKRMHDSDLWQVPVAGGEETRVVGPAGHFKFAVVGNGIYFIEPGAPGFAGWIKEHSLKFYSFAKGTAEKVFDIKNSSEIGLAVSPDGRYVLLTQIDPLVGDLMLVENFR